MEKVRLYFVKTNAGYFIAAKHENCVMILNNTNDLYLDSVQNHLEYLNNIEDDSSWEYFEKEVDYDNVNEFLEHNEILAHVDREL